MRYASLRQGLVGCWCPSVSGPFGYRLPDLSGYGNHGTLTNMASDDWVASGGKGALDFDGSDDYTVNSDAVLPSGSVPRTLSAWFQIAVPPSSDRGILCYGTAGTNFQFFGLYIQGTSGKLGMSDWHTAGALSSSNVSTGKWFHAAGTFLGSTKTIFINAVQVGTEILAGTNTVLTGYMYLGRLGTVGGYFPGQIDDARIYNRILSNSEIKLLASERGIGLKPERQRNRYLVPALPSRNRSSRFLGFPA